MPEQPNAQTTLVCRPRQLACDRLALREHSYKSRAPGFSCELALLVRYLGRYLFSSSPLLDDKVEMQQIMRDGHFMGKPNKRSGDAPVKTKRRLCRPDCTVRFWTIFTSALLAVGCTQGDVGGGSSQVAGSKAGSSGENSLANASPDSPSSSIAKLPSELATSEKSSLIVKTMNEISLRYVPNDAALDESSAQGVRDAAVAMASAPGLRVRLSVAAGEDRDLAWQRAEALKVQLILAGVSPGLIETSVAADDTTQKNIVSFTIADVR